ncbi:response regulator transcription factor [Frankia sp. Cppng1_Ct_nod]|uniref:response regulator transcription factor n=2 Tax=unclassified Frankia TaxID=2632575 RepID=UPI00104141EC|nr:response regulator transcription factor [Frankia sp. Cppng1_Ct_nod]
MDQRTCALLVEDDRNIIDLIRSNLLVRGFSVLVSTNGSDALALQEREQPDLALVDLLLPQSDGFELCRQLRQRSALGIIVVSARRAETDKVRALNLGADDYLTKPFGIDELLARINATLRRSRPAPVAQSVYGSRFAIGDVVIDLEARTVAKGAEQVRVTPTEFAILRELALQPGQLLSHATLLRRVWGPGYASKTEYTRVYVRRLRAKLEEPGGPPLIITEPRAGYRLATPRDD